MSTRTSITWPDPLHDALAALAASQGRSMASVVVDAMQQAVGAPQGPPEPVCGCPLAGLDPVLLRDALEGLQGRQKQAEDAPGPIYNDDAARRIMNYRGASQRQPISQGVTLYPEADCNQITTEHLASVGVNVWEATHYATRQSGSEVRIALVSLPERFPPDTGPWLPIPDGRVLWRRHDRSSTTAPETGHNETDGGEG